MDLCRRLSGFGAQLPTEHAVYDSSVEDAIREFQSAHGLVADGICDRPTWSRIVEAGYALGDRFLYWRLPMLRGDDVAELQARLGSLGFDAGRVDGIFGQQTSTALAEFQRNVGLPVDGRCGPETLEELRRLRSDHDPDRSIVSVKERLSLTRQRSLPDTVIALSHGGTLGAPLDLLRRSLAGEGARPLVLEHPNGSQIAAMANSAGATALLHLITEPTQSVLITTYYAGYRWESPLGHRLADLLSGSIAADLRYHHAAIQGMALPILRETRMPAVTCTIGPTALLVEHPSRFTAAVTRAFERWLSGLGT